MTTMHIYPDSNDGILIREDQNRPFSNMQDYDEFTANALSVNHDCSMLRNYTTTNLTKDNTWINYLIEETGTNVGAYTQSMAETAKRNWDLETSLMEGTHGKTMVVDYDNIAWEIFQARWLPMYKTHCQWIHNRLEDCHYDDLEDYLKDISRHITYASFDLFSGLEVDLDDIQNPQDEGSVEKLAKTWVQHLENQLAVEKENFTVSTLDMFIEFFHEMEICSIVFRNYTADGDGQMFILDQMRETACDLYIRKNPMVKVGTLSETPIGLDLTLFDVSNWTCDQIEDEINCALMGTEEQTNKLDETINQWLHGDWYWAETIRVIPQEELSQHSPADLEKFDGKLYIETGDSCGGFTSQEDAIEHFSP